MAGRGYLQAQDETTDADIWMLDEGEHWVLARDPIHFDSRFPGVGPGHQFARTLKQTEPAASIGLIPAAVGGTSLNQWRVGGELYDNAVARARQAMKHGHLRGILWHQGEAESRRSEIDSYPQRFAAMIAQLRTDLDAPDAPVVIGELFYGSEQSVRFNETVPTIAAAVPRCGWVSAQGLTDRGDDLHFSAASERKLGQRYAERFLKLEN